MIVDWFVWMTMMYMCYTLKRMMADSDFFNACWLYSSRVQLGVEKRPDFSTATERRSFGNEWRLRARVMITATFGLNLLSVKLASAPCKVTWLIYHCVMLASLLFQLHLNLTLFIVVHTYITKRYPSSSMVS